MAGLRLLLLLNVLGLLVVRLSVTNVNLALLLPVVSHILLPQHQIL